MKLQRLRNWTTYTASSVAVALSVVSCGISTVPRTPQPPITEFRSVQIVVRAGEPVAGALVSLHPQSVLIGAVTEKDGRATFKTTDQSIRVTVKATGYEQFTRTYELTERNHSFDIDLTRSIPRLPTREEALTYAGHLGNLRDSAGRVIWTPALPGASEDVRKEWLSIIAENGGTHIPIGPFTGGPVYPGVAWSNPDWTNNAAAIRALVVEILQTPSPRGHGLVPVVFLDDGGSNPIPRLTSFFPVAVDALSDFYDHILTVPAGWEPVVGSYRSVEVSWALERWHAYAPRALIAYHGSPSRLVGSSNPVEHDDPWQGAESDFYKRHGGQYIDVALYQTEHGRSLYSNCDVEQDGCWKNRWRDYVTRIGGGLNGWRIIPIVFWETCAYELFNGHRVDGRLITNDDCRDLATQAKQVNDAVGVPFYWGNGSPR